MMDRLFVLRAAVLTAASLAAAHAAAAEVRVIFGMTIPPYVIKDSNSGYELEIFREALAYKGHTLKPTYASFLAVKKMLQDKAADAAQRGAPDMTEAEGFHYASEPTAVYEDYAITVKKNNLAINSVADLKGKSIVAYQGATNFIGPDYTAVVKGNPNYQENGSSKRVVQMLYAGGVQVAVFDINIFKYYADLVKGETDTSAELTYHKIFPPSAIKTNNAVFLDKQIRDDFNAGLANLKKTGRYKQIVAKYMNR